jgi:cell division protein FtsL
LRLEHDRLQDDWYALTLEASHLLGHARIDEVARDELGLVDADQHRVYVEVAR